MWRYEPPEVYSDLRAGFHFFGEGARVEAAVTRGRYRLDDWRTFEVTTRVEVRDPTGTTRIWIPEALTDDMPFQRTLANVVQAEGGTTTVTKKSPDALAIVSVLFPPGVPPVVTLTSRVSTRDYTVDLLNTNHEAVPQSLDYFRRPTKMIPTSGIVQSTALEITKGSRSDIDKARAIYEWVVERTSRNPQTRGCGTGNIRFMLESGDLSGKCADINSLFVGLARASGLAARETDGLSQWRLETGLQESRHRLRQRHEGSALQGRGACDRPWLGARRSGGRSKGGARGAARSSSARR